MDILDYEIWKDKNCPDIELEYFEETLEMEKLIDRSLDTLLTQLAQEEEEDSRRNSKL